MLITLFPVVWVPKVPVATKRAALCVAGACISSNPLYNPSNFHAFKKPHITHRCTISRTPGKPKQMPARVPLVLTYTFHLPQATDGGTYHLRTFVMFSASHHRSHTILVDGTNTLLKEGGGMGEDDRWVYVMWFYFLNQGPLCIFKLSRQIQIFNLMSSKSSTSWQNDTHVFVLIPVQVLKQDLDVQTY